MGQRPIFVSGKVVLEDGSPPPQLAEIVRFCDGRESPEAHADPQGSFSFEFGGQALGAGEAGGWRPRQGRPSGQSNRGRAASGVENLGQVNLAGCEIRAKLPGYRSDSVALGNRGAFDNPDIGTIVLHRLDGVEGTAVSATSLAAPKDARKAFENGQKELRKKKPNREKAIGEFEKAVSAYPEYAAAWSSLGELRFAMEDPEGAQQAFENALEAEPEYLSPYEPLARLHLMAQRWDAASEVADQALQHDPHLTVMRYWKALAHLNGGNMAKAGAAALAVQQSQDARQFPQTHRILGMIEAEKGNFGGAAQQYRNYLAMEPDGPFAEDLNRRLHEWEALGVIEKAPAAVTGKQ